MSHGSLNLLPRTQQRHVELLRSKSESLTSPPKLVLCLSSSCQYLAPPMPRCALQKYCHYYGLFSPPSPPAHFQAQKFLPTNYFLTLSPSLSPPRSLGCHHLVPTELQQSSQKSLASPLVKEDFENPKRSVLARIWRAYYVTIWNLWFEGRKD